MPQFGERSEDNLATVHGDLVVVCRKAIQIYDFSVIEGARSDERQARMYHQGLSKLNGVTKRSKHQVTTADPYSKAVDLLPYPGELSDVNVWQDPPRFMFLAGAMFMAAHELGIEVRWGGDWNGDGNFHNQTFHDLPHFELLGD